MGSLAKSQVIPLTKISSDEEATLYAMQLGSASVLPMVLKAAIELDLLEIIGQERLLLRCSDVSFRVSIPSPNQEP